MKSIDSTPLKKWKNEHIFEQVISDLEIAQDYKKKVI